MVIKSGTSSYDIANQLADAGVIQHPWLFFAGYWLTGSKKPLIAGEYSFNQSESCWEVLQHIQAGRVVIRKLTVPEGWTVGQVMVALQQIDCLTGQITKEPPEGSLLPDTYLYVYGDSRQEIINRMMMAMSQQLKQLWAQRQSDNLNVQTPEAAVVLASIVEKETGIPEERARIAGVFLNRLRLGMPLQSDPTVIYALTLGKKPLDRSLTRGDLSINSVYNTYKINGLPPHPIACPGIQALKAVLNPVLSRDLYFVANGTGGHSFSETLEQHNHYVSKWRQFNRQIINANAKKS
ncbi:endolytic transglycosylase MltG [Candidatus Finniella inopinata]|uniref:endolytic transglycosylase MltG n=1 Tax=Candidatus Finniella inopinata TaxID=1696036 RepID=UPI0013EED4F9|nr:endolytic transglycosylase MltG [Candidatus Finniella inopinata]